MMDRYDRSWHIIPNSNRHLGIRDQILPHYSVLHGKWHLRPEKPLTIRILPIRGGYWITYLKGKTNDFSDFSTED